MKVAVPLAENILASFKALALFKEKCIVVVVRARTEITLLTSNKDMDDNIRIIKSLKKLDVLVVGVKETVKNEIKRQESASMLLTTLGASMLVKML